MKDAQADVRLQGRRGRVCSELEEALGSGPFPAVSVGSYLRRGRRLTLPLHTPLPRAHLLQRGMSAQ